MSTVMIPKRKGYQYPWVSHKIKINLTAEQIHNFIDKHIFKKKWKWVEKRIWLICDNCDYRYCFGTRGKCEDLIEIRSDHVK